MTFSALTSVLLPLMLQAAPHEGRAPEKPATFEDLSIEEATGPRCGVAFAIVQGWQEAGDPRGSALPDLKAANAREFFLTAMVRLIDAYGLDRTDVQRLVDAEIARHTGDNFARVGPMMPACLVLLEASQSQGG